MTHDFSSTTCCPTPTVGAVSSQSLMASCTSSSMSSMTYAPSPGYPTLVPFSLSNHHHPHPHHHHQHHHHQQQHHHHHQASSPMFAVSPMSSINSQMNSMNHMNSMSVGGGSVAASMSSMSPNSKSGTISLAAVSVPLSFYLGAPASMTSMAVPTSRDHNAPHLSAPTVAAAAATAASLSTYSTPVLDVSLLRPRPNSTHPSPSPTPSSPHTHTPPSFRTTFSSALFVEHFFFCYFLFSGRFLFPD